MNVQTVSIQMHFLVDMLCYKEYYHLIEGSDPVLLVLVLDLAGRVLVLP